MGASANANANAPSFFMQEREHEFDRSAEYDGKIIFKVGDRARIICAVAFAVVLSLLSRPLALSVAAVVPVLLLFLGGSTDVSAGKNFSKTLLHLNYAGAIMTVLLLLTVPDVREGLRLGVLVIIRLNLISIVLFHGVLFLGVTRVYSALTLLKFPEKLRLLLLFTLHGVRVLSDRERALLTALNLRAPHLHGVMKWRAFAAMLGMVMLQGTARSERTMMAVQCRGGFAGFNQILRESWLRRDTVFCLACVIFTGLVLFLEFKS